MKEVSHKIVSIAMALFLLLSTTSWKVEKHYCMGLLINIALFSDVDSCRIDMGSMSIENDDISENSCCDDEVIVFDGQDNLRLSLDTLDIKKQSLWVAYIYSYATSFFVQNVQLVPHIQYPPPQLVKDIQMHDQVFLI